ncbi:MAG: TolC family protein [Vicinamibacterales bacterium]
MTGPVRATVLLAALVLSCAASVGYAQETITLDDAVARAQKQSGRLAEIEARRAGAGAVERGRAAARMPVAALLAGYTRTNHVQEFSIVAPGVPPRVLYPDVPDNIRTRLDLQWPIYTGGRAEALIRAATAEASAAAEDLESARADLRLEVTIAFWSLATARDTERVVTLSLENVDAHVRDLRTRLDEGLIPPNEVTSAEARRSHQRLLAIEAANRRAIAEADLRRLVGGDGAIVPGAALESASALSPAPPEAPLPALFGAERRALDFRLGASQARERAAAGTGRPQVAAGGGYDLARPNPRIFPRAGRLEDSWDASINLSWTLWDGGRRRAEQAEASSFTRAAQARVADFERQVAFELQRRRLELESARAAIDAAADGVRSAVETRRVVSERYQAGVIASTEVLDAELGVLQAELDRTRAFAATKVAQARLERAGVR